MSNYPECPVDLVKTDENQVRITAFFVVVLISLFLITRFWPIPGFLVIDFALRALQLGKVSPLALVSKSLVTLFKIPAKPVDRSPKIFAARIGLVFSLSVLAASIYGFNTLSYSLAGVLLVFALLEYALGFCAACFIYPYWKSAIQSISEKLK